MKHEDIPTNKIKIGLRHRNDLGDLEALAASIREMGLLQPIGVDRYYNLIFGMRRLIACGDMLQWKQIPAVILDIESMLAGEYAENEFRKQFTASERAEIGKAIEEELGNRKGQRTDLSAIAAKSDQGKTVDLAAKRAGFKSAETFERAKAVVATGSPGLIAAMDKGEIRIDAAAKIASQPKQEQERIVQMPKDERREVVNQIRKTKADREADERRAYDLRVFRGLAEAVEEIAGHTVEAKETWMGLHRVAAYRFGEHLDKAIICLIRIQKEHPNAVRKPGIVPRTAH